MNDADDPRDREELGSMAEEAAKLLGAFSGWARDHAGDLGDGLAGMAGHAASVAGEVNEHVATGAPECTYCPICRTVHVVRTLSPEVREHLSVAAASLGHAIAALMAPPEQADRSQSDRGASGDVGDRGMERIDVEDDWT